MAESRLAIGRREAAVTMLGAHIGEHPWREEGWRVLALALYRSSRQVDALGVIAQARSNLLQDLGFEPSDRLTELENGIMRHDPSLNLAYDGGWILSRTVTASARTGARSQLESVAVLLPVLAVSGFVEFAAEQRMSAIVAAEQFGDPELAARVTGGFDVPGIWTRSDDPMQSASIVEAAFRTLMVLPSDTSDRVRARLLATIAMESRGSASRLAVAEETESTARRLADAPLLCFALSACYMQTFDTSGYALRREAIGSESLAIALEAELPTFEIQGRLIRMQALCALNDVAAASQEADSIDKLAARFDRPLASLFTAWFRWAFMRGPQPVGGTEMPGFRIGLNAIAKLTAAVPAGTELPDGDFGPYEPWFRPLLLVRKGSHGEASVALDTVPDPPHDLMAEVSWLLIGLAAIECGNRTTFVPCSHAGGRRTRKWQWGRRFGTNRAVTDRTSPVFHHRRPGLGRPSANRQSYNRLARLVGQPHRGCFKNRPYSARSRQAVPASGIDGLQLKRSRTVFLGRSPGHRAGAKVRQETLEKRW